jgi:hypothetical protein
MHNWGDDGVDWNGINDAANFIGNSLLFWGRINVSQYKENIICYTQNHPSEYYFKALYKKLIDILDKNLYHDINEEDIELPGPDFSPFPLDLHWFRENFKDLTVSRVKYTTFIDISFVDAQVELVKLLSTEDLQMMQPKLNLLRA